MEDDDDPVVKEVNVFLSKQLMETLHLLQYQVRPSHLPYDDIEHLSVKMKPQQQKIEMEIAMNTSCPNYSRSKGEQIALNVDGANPNPADQVYQSGVMDKQVFRSFKIPLDGFNAVGYLKDNELHLNPMKGMSELQSCFSHFDKADTRMKEQECDEVPDDEEEAKPVIVKFARHETEDAKARRMASYEYLRRTQEEEKWISMQYYSRDQDMAEAERSLLICRQPDDFNEFNISEESYLNKLIEKQKEETTEKPALPSNTLSLSDLKSMNIGDQVKTLMMSTKVIRFSQLMTFVSKGSEQEHVLRYLQQVALLVQGVWVVKSEVLYPPESKSAISGVPADLLCRGRDYIMWRFTQNRILKRNEIASVIKLQAEDVENILKQISVSRKLGWEFLLDYDADFVKFCPPEILQRQQMLWKAKFDSLSKVLKMIPADMKMAAACITSPPKRRRTVSRSHPKSGAGGMSDQSDTDTPDTAERKRRGSGARGRGQEEPMDMMHANGNGAGGHNIQPPPMAGEYLTPENAREMEREVVVFIRELLLSRNVLKLSDLRTQLNLKLLGSPTSHALGRGVSDSLLLTVIRASGAVEIPMAVTKLSEPLFVNRATGDVKLDPIREVVVKMLGTSNRIIVKAVKNTVNEQFEKDDPSLDSCEDSDVRKVVKEYCYSRASNWILKGT